MQYCTQCATEFEVSEQERILLRKLSPALDEHQFELPVPAFCWRCRLQQRLAFSNESFLYSRNENLHGTSLISIFGAHAPFPVYRNSDWWSDAWDPLTFGREYDFTRPFFEQFRDLMKVVPRAHARIFNSENCDYCAVTADSKDSYLCVGLKLEKCLYGHWGVDNLRCLDWCILLNCRYCYQCISCTRCYELRFCQYCLDCQNSWFLYDCHNCDSCYGCAGLRRKQFYVFNQFVGKEAFQKFISEANLSSRSSLEVWQTKFDAFRLTLPVLFARLSGSEDSSGDGLSNAKNAHYCFMAGDTEGQILDSYYVTCSCAAKDCMDCNDCGSGSELCYGCNGATGFQLLFSHDCWGSDIWYSNSCGDCSSVFGSIGLRQKQNCILNKQYSKEDYKRLLPQIVEHLRKTGEWGREFPATLSPFGYNETIAQDFFALSEEKARDLGFSWLPDLPSSSQDRSPNLYFSRDIPDQEISEHASDWVVRCELSNRSFRYTRDEIKFYRDFNLPLPNQHPHYRHQSRLRRSYPYGLWDRKCAHCSSNFKTSFSPQSPEIVYCAACYASWVQQLN